MDLKITMIKTLSYTLADARDQGRLHAQVRRSGAPNDKIFPNASEVYEMCYSVLGEPV